MQAKTETDLINGAATGRIKVCPNCQSSNDVDARCCTTCGSEFETKADSQGTTPFASLDEVAATVESEADQKVSVQYQEKLNSVFAEGLPLWTLEPPQVVVRRKR